MDAAFRKALREGAADALGFVLGALAGRAAGQALGFDFFAPGDWQLPQIVGLAMIIAGCAAGRWLFRKLLERLP